MLGSNTWNYLTVCEQMISGLFENVTYRQFVYKSYILNICIYRSRHWITYKGWYAIKPNQKPTWNHLTVCKQMNLSLDLHFHFLSRGIILWIELPWPENPANTYTWHTETLDSYFNLIMSHQQCILWSLPQAIEPATTDCRAKTLQLSHQLISQFI